MKKYALMAFALICACSLTVLAQPGTRDGFTKAINKTEKIQHPVFEKVFPGIKFSVETSSVTLPFAKRVVGWFQGERFIMTDEFNFLYDKVADSSRASVDERMEAFIRLCYWRQDPDLTVLSQEEVSIKKNRYIMNRRIVIQLHHENRGSEDLEVLIRLHDKRIRTVYIYKDGRPVGSPRVRYWSSVGMDELDEIELVITGNVIVEPPDEIY
jgi:hypothetical protein